MTKEELKNDGWRDEICRAGILYFKDEFFCIFVNDDTVKVCSVDDDMNSLGRAKTLEKLNELQKKYRLQRIKWLRFKLENAEQFYKDMYGELPEI